ncbi:unnamed protein product [Adineta steineri]|uniref:F-box domain-containing protein n=1 Tax=Adineta steineri TaxID=433720 RepID=A0A819F056_9BILA|nr:unnamed protein product [Adineta steineri]CAF3859466.1 unnamed protein product [Adineta steineri]
MSNAIRVPTHFTALPNEIVLIIFMYLTYAETIKSFGSLKCQRYKRLLQTYCYKSIDFYTTTFSTFQLCCTQMLNQFRLNVQILKLGHRDCYSQLRIFSRYCLSSSSLLDVFPQLQTLVLRNVHDSDVNDLVPYLPTIPFIDKIILNECPLNKASILICRYLLNNSLNNRLTSCTLNSTNVRLGTEVKSSDQELFPLSFDPCSHLTKLVLRLRDKIVQDFRSIIKFILLFRNTLLTLHLSLIHQDLNFKHTLTYIDGHHLFNEIVIHMKMMKDFSFWIETVCLCKQQMNNIIQSFQTKYWLTMHIGCYHDSEHNLYIMFTLPYVHNLGFVVSNDVIHTHFNHTDDRLDYLISMLYMKAPRIDILTGVNKSLSGTFLRMLKQGWHRGKSIRIIPYGIYHLEHNNDHNLMPFDTLEIIGCYRNQSIDINLFVVDGFINTTITWLNWMPHIRILNIDNERLLHLCINNININRFLSLELLIIHQINNSQLYEALSIISSLGSSSSLHTIHLQQYGSNYRFTADDLLLILNQIRHNLSGLKIMTIEFHKDAIFNIEILDKLTDIQKKNCHLEYIHISNAYIELWFH